MMTGKDATLDISGSPGGTVSATLTGNATVANELELSPPFKDFGSWMAGQVSPDFTFTLTNINPAPNGAAISALSFSFVQPGVFAVAPPPIFAFNVSDCVQRAQGFLLPGASCVVTIHFQVPAGTTAGLKQLNWQVTGASRDGTTALATAHVQGTVQ
jgi:hypothetical protein